MGANNTKVECLWLPGQSGKTRKIKESIEKTSFNIRDLKEIYGIEEHFNIIICSNNKSLVDQTNVRMTEELYKDEDIGVFSWRSVNGKMEDKNCGNIEVKSLCYNIIEDELNMLLCCANPTRIKYLFNLLETLEKSKNFNTKIDIWIDEADSSL